MTDTPKEEWEKELLDRNFGTIDIELIRDILAKERTKWGMEMMSKRMDECGVVAKNARNALLEELENAIIPLAKDTDGISRYMTPDDGYNLALSDVTDIIRSKKTV